MQVEYKSNGTLILSDETSFERSLLNEMAGSSNTLGVRVNRDATGVTCLEIRRVDVTS